MGVFTSNLRRRQSKDTGKYDDPMAEINATTGLLDLPNEILEIISKNIDGKDRRNMSHTCHRLWEAIVVEKIPVPLLTIDEENGCWKLEIGTRGFRKTILVQEIGFTRSRKEWLSLLDSVWISVPEGGSTSLTVATLLKEAQLYFEPALILSYHVPVEMCVPLIRPILQFGQCHMFTVQATNTGTDYSFLSIIEQFVCESSIREKYGDKEERTLHIEEVYEVNEKEVDIDEPELVDSSRRLLSRIETIVDGWNMDGCVGYGIFPSMSSTAPKSRYINLCVHSTSGKRGLWFAGERNVE